MSEEELLAGRTSTVLNQWPTLIQASGCVNCNGIFREPTQQGTCPHCNSTSVFDVAAALAVERASVAEIVGKVQGMIERIDEEINGAPI